MTQSIMRTQILHLVVIFSSLISVELIALGKDFRDQVVEKAEKTAQSIRTEAPSLSTSQLNRIEGLLKEIETTLWPPARSFSLEGKMGAISAFKDFDFQFKNLDELLATCNSFFHDANFYENKVDDIRVFVDPDNTITKHKNSYYWTNSVEVCDQVIQIAKQLYPSAPINSDEGRYCVQGLFQKSIIFHFAADTRENIYQQCIKFWKDRGEEIRLDHIQFWVNASELKTAHKDYDHWTSAREVCQQIIAEIPKD
jgi:hypothetical protein